MNDKTQRFETMLLPHLDAAYNLARWLVRDEHLAHDLVQDAYLRAFRFFDNVQGEAARPWLMGIVRNTCYDYLRQRSHEPFLPSGDEDDASADERGLHGVTEATPESLLLEKCDGAQIDAAIAALAPAYREVIVLRELEDLSYEEIAQVAGIPIGTVMSRLARARGLLRATLATLATRKS